jgi:ABC-type iron transport system FetAB permease component
MFNLSDNPWLVLILILWILPWKAVALWKAARLSQKWWFIALFIINTIGILEILYIFVLSNKKKRTPAEKKSADNSQL